MANSVLGSTGCNFSSFNANCNGLKTAAGFGVTIPAKPVRMDRGMDGVFVTEGVLVMVGVVVTVRVRVIVGVSVMVGVGVIVAVGG